MTREIVIIGGLGNGSVIAGAIQDAGRRGDASWKVKGYLNDRESPGETIEGLPVLGPLSEAAALCASGAWFINSIYRIDGQDARLELFDGLAIPDERLATFVHPSSYVAPSVSLGPGTVIMPHVCVSSGTTFGRCCLVMAGALIGHNNAISEHCHFAAHSCVGAYLRIERGVHIGLNATIRENLKIGECATIGMGSVLTKDVGPFEIWAGNPARFLRRAGREVRKNE